MPIRPQTDNPYKKYWRRGHFRRERAWSEFNDKFRGMSYMEARIAKFKEIYKECTLKEAREEDLIEAGLLTRAQQMRLAEEEQEEIARLKEKGIELTPFTNEDDHEDVERIYHEAVEEFNKLDDDDWDLTERNAQAIKVKNTLERLEQEGLLDEGRRRIFQKARAEYKRLTGKEAINLTGSDSWLTFRNLPHAHEKRFGRCRAKENEE